VHPVFQDISDRPEMARTIQQLELTSKRYFYRSQNIQSLDGFQGEMKNAGIDKVILQMPGAKGVRAR